MCPGEGGVGSGRGGLPPTTIFVPLAPVRGLFAVGALGLLVAKEGRRQSW